MKNISTNYYIQSLYIFINNAGAKWYTTTVRGTGFMLEEQL
jgi:hypothetical protein